MVKYIEKAIDYRVPADYKSTHKLNDLTNSGYLMKPFEKDASNNERPAGYYADTLKGWLSSGQYNSTANEVDKKASYWYFDEEFAREVNSFTNYAIPPSPGSNDTKIDGATYSALEPYMLMKNPAVSTYANSPASALAEIAPMTPFNADMSRYGSNRFVNYEKLANPTGDAGNSANLQGYDTVTVDTYYMKNIPSVTINDNKTLAYDGAGAAANVPMNTKAELVPLMAPYEIVKSEIVDMSSMTKAEGNTYSFTIPEKAVQVSCLVNTEPNKLVIVGTHSTYYVKKDDPMNVSFDVPALDNGYTYKTANVNIPARANINNAVNMTGVMNGESYTVTNANISGTGTVIPGENNVLTVTHKGEGGVDYYSYIGGWNESGYDYPVTAANLSTLTLTKAVKADMTRLTTDTTNADTNSDAAGYYIEDIAIPSWNPALKWEITFNDGKTAQSKVSLPILSGGGSISMGIILYGELGGTEASYTTKDIKNVTVIE